MRHLITPTLLNSRQLLLRLQHLPSGRPCRPCPRLQPRAQPLRAAVQEENALTAVQELLGATGEDPGHWNYSPEWFGTQDGGWGRDPGETVFVAQSEHGNGTVAVTSHGCSLQECPPGSVQQWRVLRFNGITRQTVAKVTLSPPPSAALGSSGASHGSSSSSSSSSSGRQTVGPGGQEESAWSVTQQADCLAPEYLKTMASLAAALLGLQGLLELTQSSGSSSGMWGSAAGAAGAPQPLRVLCVGVGGGSLPLFLAHHFPQAEVDAVELDPVVVAASTLAMGLPTGRPNLRLHTADALRFVEEFVASQQAQQARQGAVQHYDLVFLDAFDGEDNVPEALCSPAFAALLAEAVHPRHGSLVLNMHTKSKPRPTLLPGFMLGSTLPPELGYDPDSPDGQCIRAAAATFVAAFSGAGASPTGSSGGDSSDSAPSCGGGSSSGSAHSSGGSSSSGEREGSGGGSRVPVRAFTVSVARQLNVEVVVARGLPLEHSRREAAFELKTVAAAVAAAAGYRFPAGRRACKGFSEL